MAVAVDAAVASIGNDHDVKLKYTVELRALNIQHMKNTLMVQVCAFPGSPNHQIPGVCVQVFRFSSQVWAGTHVWEFRLSIQVCVWVLTFSIHIQGIQVYNSGLGVQTCLYAQACIPKPECLNVNT